jgi:serine protease Do
MLNGLTGSASRITRVARVSALSVSLAAALVATACTSGGNGGGSASRSTGEDPRINALDKDIRNAIAGARDQVFPALVNIDVVSLAFDGGKETKQRATGSGTIISKEGHVLTNAHVTDEGHRFWCVLADKQRIPATLVGEDPWTDLAVLKLDLSKLAGGGKNLPIAAFGDSDRLRVGDYVLAMGSPFSLSRTVTLGVVSNTERVFTSIRDAGDVDQMMLNFDQRTGTFTNWIQHDALINPGNSGGPLVDLQGRVVGVNTRGGSGMAFASPSNLAQAVAKELIDKGEVVRSTLGVTFRHLEGTGLSQGVLADSLEDDGAAAKAGLKAGDVITKIDGQPVTVRFAEEVPPLLGRIARLPVGTSVDLEYQRQIGTGDKGVAKAVTTKLLRDKGEEEGLRLWGVTVQEITERMQQRMRLLSRRGALVSSVDSGGTAGTAEPALNWGDVILKINGEDIADIKGAARAYEKIANLDKAKRPEWVMIEFEREGKNWVTIIKPAPAESPDPPIEARKAWVGVATQPVIKTLAKQMGDESRTGFRVTRVYTDTEAAKSGLKVGDLIVGLNDSKLVPKTQQEAGAFNREVRKLKIGEPAKLKVIRGGAEQDISLALESTKLEAGEAPRYRDSDFELAAREITFFDRQDRRWDDTLKGALVENVENAGWAGLGGIRAGDVIQRIDNYEITDIPSFRKAMEAIGKAQPSRVVFVVFRGFRTSFRFVEPDWKPSDTHDGKAAQPGTK